MFPGAFFLAGNIDNNNWHAIGHLLQMIDNDPIAIVESGIDQPPISHGTGYLDAFLFSGSVFACNINIWFSFGITHDNRLRNENGVFLSGLYNEGLNEHPRKQVVVRVGEYRPDGDGTCIGVGDGVGKFPYPFLIVVGAVFQGR